MATRRQPQITDADGVTGVLRGVDAEDPQHPRAVVQLANGARVRVPFDLLDHHLDGGYTMAARWPDFVQVADEAALIPIIEERVQVSVQPAPETRVTARRRVVTEQRTVEVPVWHERIAVEHVPINQFVDTVPTPRQEGDTLVIPVIEEVPVVQTRLCVREELRVRVVREQHIHRETVTLRRHALDVDTTSPPSTPSPRAHEGEEV